MSTDFKAVADLTPAAEVKRKTQVELDLVLDALQSEYGYDFSRYSKESLLRRLEDLRSLFQFNHLSQIIPLILWDGSVRDLVMSRLTVGVTEIFRDSDFYISLRDRVLPRLSTFPYCKIWHAGCSTGEEVYSTAMVLRDQSLLENTIVYGTDINRSALETAKAGIYPAGVFDDAEMRSSAILTNSRLSDHYHGLYNFVRMDETFLPHLTFSHHDLVQEGVFGEMNIIFCRNVLIYFDRDLQGHVLKLFYDSLRPGGYLCLGKGESLHLSPVNDSFQVIDLEQRIYQKRH